MYDGCCGSGGMFVQSEKFIELHEHRKGKISIFGHNINKAETHKWKYGIPPTGNANYAWLQHFVSKLAPYV